MTHLKQTVIDYFSSELTSEDLTPYSNYAVKLNKKNTQKRGKLVIVSSMTPNPKGAGKTTTTIGLADALTLCDKKAIPVLRQPSLGPVLGRKGGATGGGNASLQFENEINFHFTGDIHAITSAHNAISAQIDNEIFFETDLNIDKDTVVWPRCLDMNERALKEITIHYPTKPHLDHKGQFIITVASELMSIISIATSIRSLKDRIDKILVAYTTDGKPVFVSDLKITDALVILLKHSLAPNITLTLEDTPAFIHGGAFANIAHGTTTVTALRHALALSDYTICETGFGADLGFEKFVHLIATEYDLTPDHLVLVISVPMLKALSKNQEQPTLDDGLLNLSHHLNWISKTGIPVIVALNQFADTSNEEINFLSHWCKKRGVEFAPSNSFAKGAQGCLSLAQTLIKQTATTHFTPLYDHTHTFEDKLQIIAQTVYGASQIQLSPLAQKQLLTLKQQQWDTFPICVAKSPFLLIPKNDFGDDTLYIKSIEVRTGARFIVVYADNVIAMPALPLDPNAKHMTISDDGIILMNT